MLIFAVISEPFFDWAIFGKIYVKSYQNIYFTLLTGLIMLECIEFIRKHQFNELKLISYVLEGIIVILACGDAIFKRSDYEFYGILMIYWFYALRFNKVLMGLFEAYTNMELIGGVQGFAVLALIPIYMYNGKKGYNKSKWLFYAFYPLVLLIIGFISQKDAQWSKHGTTCPHHHPHDPFTVTCHFISRIVNDIIDDKYQYRYNDRHSQASLTNNTSQRGPDKEEKKTSI